MIKKTNLNIFKAFTWSNIFKTDSKNIFIVYIKVIIRFLLVSLLVIFITLCFMFYKENIKIKDLIPFLKLLKH